MSIEQHIDTYIYRYSIFENIDELVEYGKQFQKQQNNTQQLSLFDFKETISRPNFELKQVNPYLVLEKESEALGIPISYNIYDEYMLQELYFCNCTLEELETEPSDRSVTFLAQFKEMTLNYENSIGKGRLIKNKLELKTVLFSKEIEAYYKYINRKDIFLIKGTYSAQYNSIRILKLKPVKDVKFDIKNVKIILDTDNEFISQIRAYIYANMYSSRSNTKLIFKIEDSQITANYNINFNSTNYIDLLKYNVKIEIEA